MKACVKAWQDVIDPATGRVHGWTSSLECHSLWSNAYIEGSGVDIGADLFRRGLCLPSDNKMTPEQQKKVIEVIHRCFR